jgi:hypothetical protein
MIDYIPLIVTFLLAVLGLLLKTTRDPEGESLRKRLTGGGLSVLLLLLVALTLGVALTVKRKRADDKSAQQAAARYVRDSTIAAANLQAANSQLRMQQGAIGEARSAAATQLHRLDSTLTTSNILARNLSNLGDSLRAQRAELDRELREQQQLIQAEADRLLNPITIPRIRLGVSFPPSLPFTDSVRIRLLQVIRNSSYRDGAQFSISEEEPYIFPSSFVIFLWPASDEGCHMDELWKVSRFVSFTLRTPMARWKPLPLSILNFERRGFNLDWAEAEVRNAGVLSLADLHGGCYDIRPSFEDWENPVVRQLFHAIWRESVLTYFEMEFSAGQNFGWPYWHDIPYAGHLPRWVSTEPRR